MSPRAPRSSTSSRSSIFVCAITQPIPYLLICCVRQQCDITGALDGFGKHALMYGAVARDVSRENLASLGGVVLQQPQVFEVDLIDFLDAKAADAPPVHATAAALH